MTGLIGWVGVNVSPERASTRFKDILRMDEECVPNQNVAPGYENLRKYYQQRRLESEEYGVIQKLIEYTKGNPGEYDKLLMFMTLKSAARYRKPFLDALDSLSVAVQHSKQRLSKGEDTLSWAAKERFLFDAYCRFLIAGRVFYDIDIQQQGEMLKAGLPTLPYGYEVLGWHYSLKEEDASALKGFEASYGMDSIRINTLLGLGMTYCRLVVRNNATNEQLQKFASAGLYCFERALAIQPKPWLLMDHQVGYLYLWLGQYAKAREYFQRYLKGDSSSTSAQWVKSQLSELDRSGR
jgi:tetratricopeptide (TPR) repeat protein